MIAMTRRYRFSAAHVLARRDLSFPENERIYGKCANPAGHGHSYTLDVTVSGPLQPGNGRVMEPAVLDAVVKETVLERLDHRCLNDDPWFRDHVPTTENLARVVHEALCRPVADQSSARLLGVEVIETPRNRFAYGEQT